MMKQLVEKGINGIRWRVRKLSRWIHRILVRIYKILTQKLLYPSVYRKYAKQPPEPGKIVFLEERMPQLTDNFIRIYQMLEKEKDVRLVICSLGTQMVSQFRQLRNCLATLREIATAKVVFLNDSSALISCIPLRKETTVIQTWHACGAFKKFGFSTAEKKFGGNREELLKYPLHKNFSYVTVSSPEVVWAYAEAFHMENRVEDILPTGISRTDVFFDAEAIAAAGEKLHRLFPESIGKKVLLYAPTYRGRVRFCYSPEVLDLHKLQSALGKDYVIVMKHHPFVKHRPQIPQELSGFARDMTGQMEIEELLMVSDICISDYSSLIFEYSLFERPMLFLAYDLEEYFDWRGFYYPYEEMTPGPVVQTTEEVIDYITHIGERFDLEQVRAFKEKFMSACDGHATERIVALAKEKI